MVAILRCEKKRAALFGDLAEVSGAEGRKKEAIKRTPTELKGERRKRKLGPRKTP